MLFLKSFFSAFILLMLVDFTWLAVIANKIYFTEIGSLLRQTDGSLQPNVLSAVMVYVLLALGVIVFALPKAGNSPWMAMFWGAVLGLIVYGVYDYTNMATLENWTWKLTFIDIAWGTYLCGLVTWLVYLLQQKVF
jgi:uncharacterized membrane protein